jgi:hypothetical protein
VADLPLIRATPAELPAVNLTDALAILPVIAAQEPDLYERAACRWLGRLALEREIGLRPGRPRERVEYGTRGAHPSRGLTAPPRLLAQTHSRP